MSRAERIEAALRELVALKDLKDSWEEKAARGLPPTQADLDYERRKPVAWAEARVALALPEAPTSASVPKAWDEGDFDDIRRRMHPGREGSLKPFIRDWTEALRFAQAAVAERDAAWLAATDAALKTPTEIEDE